MADLPFNVGGNATITHHDVGDGTHAVVVAAAGMSANPAGTALTHASGTTAYAVDDLISNNATAGSIVVPTMTFARVGGGGGVLAKVRLYSNHTTGLANVAVEMRLWSAAPTYTNGDNGAYAVATGAANLLAKLSGTFEQHGDGAVAFLTPSDGSADVLKLASCTTVAWDLKAKSAFTPQSGKTFTPYPEVLWD